MCLNLLRELSDTPLPCTRADAAVIDRLRLLDAAGLIKVLIPPSRVDCDHCLRQDPTTVLEVTPRGWEALRTNMVGDEMPLPALRRGHSRRGGLIPTIDTVFPSDAQH